MIVHLLGYVAFLVGAVVVASVIAVLAWRNRSVAGALALVVLMAAISVWGIAKIAELWSSGVDATVFWVNVQYVGIVVVPAAWLVFGLSYTGRDVWLSRPVLAALTVEPIAVLVAVWTNGSHGLFRSSIGLISYGPFSALESTLGPAFWVHLVYSYVLLAVGTGSLLLFVLLSDNLYRGQSVGLLTAAVIPWIGNAVYLSGAGPSGLDPTIVAFAVTGAILLAVISNHRFLGVAPVAREVARSELVDRMADAVIVIDQRDRVVDRNRAAETLVGGTIEGDVGRPLSEVHPRVADAIGSEPTGGQAEFRTELEMRADNAFRHYDVRVSTMERGFGAVAGRLISLRDVTERRQREQQLDVLNRLLRHNVRNELNVVQGNVTLLEDISTNEQATDHIDVIASTVETMIERSEKATRLADQAGLATYGSTDLTTEIAVLIEDKRQAHPDAVVTLDTPEEARVAAGPAVVTAIDELVTNAIVHNDSATPTVRVSVMTDGGIDGRYVEIEVRDDGPGIPSHEMEPIRRGRETPLEHGSGVGLWLVTWIVREVDGDIEFHDADDGTVVSVLLPSAGDDPPERESSLNEYRTGASDARDAERQPDDPVGSADD